MNELESMAQSKEVGSLFTLCLKGSKNKKLYSNTPPPDSLAKKYTQMQTPNNDDGVKSESLSGNRNRNKVRRIIHIYVPQIALTRGKAHISGE